MERIFSVYKRTNRHFSVKRRLHCTIKGRKNPQKWKKAKKSRKKLKKTQTFFDLGIAKPKEVCYNKRALNKARWSSGQDASLSRWNQGFDSPTGHLERKGTDLYAKILLHTM